jgi:hypothetical protein
MSIVFAFISGFCTIAPGLAIILAEICDDKQLLHHLNIACGIVTILCGFCGMYSAYLAGYAVYHFSSTSDVV